MKWYIRRLGQRNIESPASLDKDKKVLVSVITKSYRRALRRLPGRSKCLIRAIVLKKMLDKHGIPSTIYIGVSRQENKMVAHAWIRCGEQILSGEEEMGNFNQLVYFT